MKKGIYVSGLLGVITFFFAGAASANVPSLQVAPLSYTGNLKSGVVESGYIDVANPSDESIQVTSSVQGFRQIDSKGDLAFFNSQVLSQGITVSLPVFTLGSREAIRVGFTLDPSKLPHGGVYGAIFFRTVPSAQNSSSSFILQSANVGTLLLLTNGRPSPPQGKMKLSMPFFQFGGGLSGTASLTNLDSSESGTGVRPALRTKVTPWGTSVPFTPGLVLPGVTRDFAVSRPGSYFGILPITASDMVSGAKATTWVVAATGAYQLGVPLGIILVVLLYLLIKPRLRRPKPAPPVSKSMDGLSRIVPPNPAPAAVAQEPQESQLEALESKERALDSGLEPKVVEEKPPKQSVPVKSKSKTPVTKPKTTKRKPKKDS